MESFVLNLFSDQLSKVILDFNPNTINASLLSGKGSITNLRLNVDVINEFLNKPPHGTLPFVKFTEIRLSELRVEVTSYTNLKKAPIVLVIDEVYASAVEPLDYYLDPTNSQNKATPRPPPPQQQQSNNQARQTYGLLHRILDNLSIKINRIHLTFQTLGKFKTLRRGIWTPPPVSVTLENIEWISVSEAGNPGTPETVWAHNELFAQQSRFRKEGNAPQHRSYIIYKRLSMICHVRLSSEAHYDQTDGQHENNVKSAALISNTQIDVHVAYIRRLRDAGVTGIDVDVLCHDMDINLDVASLSDTNNDGSNASQSSGCDVGSFVHMMIGLLHCYYKDRSFIDPLLPDGTRNKTKQHISIAEAQSEKGIMEGTGNNKPEDDQEEGIGPDDFMPEVSLMDDVDSDSDYEEEPDEEHDEAFLEWKRRHDMQRDGIVSDAAVTNDMNADSPTTQVEKLPKEESEKKEYKRKRKAVIVIASGAQKFEKLSFSLSVSRVNVKLCLPSHSSIESNSLNALDRHCVELLVEGLVAECIWPKVSGEIGGHVQFSFGYVHILDLLQRLCVNRDDRESSWTAVKIFPLLKIGTRLFQGHDIFALPQHLKKGWGGDKQWAVGIDKCDEFPSMESRKTTWTWDRPRRGKRAFGLKSTISFVDEKLTTWSKTSVNHEACLGTVDIVLDSVPIDNMMKVFSNQSSLIDARWLSGDWTAEICNDAIAGDTFRMRDYLQPLPAIYQSHRTSTLTSLPSSELRSITAHLGSINIRLPNPGGSISSFGMADVICGFTEATIIVSSDLPKSFLSGRIMACENSNPDFPNDPTDISCSLEPQQALSSGDSTQFIMQVSVTNFSLEVLPMHQALHRGDNIVKSLVAPTNVTLMVCLEQIGATKQSIIVSVLLQELESNMNLRLLCGALQTLNYHACKIMLRPNATSHIDEKVAVRDVGGDNNVSLTLCFHVPNISVQCWGEDSDFQSKLLFHAKAKHTELGSESMSGAIDSKSVLKIAIEIISVDICSEGDMLELLSIGNGSSHVIALGQRAAESCSLSKEAGKPTDGGGLSLRVEHHCDVSGTMPSLSYAIDNKSPLAITFSFDALEVFLKKFVEALSLPVLEQNTSLSIGNSIVASIHQLCSIFALSQEDSDVEVYHEARARNTLMRFFLSQIILLVEVSDDKSYLFLAKDIEIASGQYDKIAALAEDPLGGDLFICKHCGGDNQTWLDAYHLLDPDTKIANATFYALNLQHTMMSVEAGNSFDVVVPTDFVNYRFPIPKGGSSKPSLIDVNRMKQMMRHSMKMGKSFTSSYYKLYSMVYATLSSDVSPTALSLYPLIADYHEKMQSVIRHLNAEVHSLKEGIFFKERERIGALALASSTASGWVRVGEDSSFSATRLFTSATFWRYWMVLDKSIILLYKTPGCTAPSFIIPMHKSTKLRTISMSSSSNKNTVVGNHLRQKGFALFDESEGMELFFVANNQTEYDMFVSSIGRVLNSMQIDSNTKLQKGVMSMDIVDGDNANYLSSEAGTIQTAEVGSSPDEFSAPVVSDANDPLSVFEAAATIDTIVEDSNVDLMGETEEMIDIQLDDEEGGSTEAVFVNNDQSQYEQTQNSQLLQSEDSSNKNSSNASLSMRERLALAKGKSKLASSKIGSTLKNAKLAASEISREDIKQKGSQRMTVLKKTANTKLSSAAVLGKASLIQATTAVRSTINEQSTRTNSSDSMDKQNPSKLLKVNKSMSSAMQRLHIDEKVTRLSTAVKSVKSESQVVRQLSSEMVSRRKIGIAGDHVNKPVKFDARETFTAISGHPNKVKSIVSGESLVTNGRVCVEAELQKFNGSWLVDVSATGLSNRRADVTVDETKDDSSKSHHQLKYDIALIDVCNNENKHSVERSISELLLFHVAISELIANTSIPRDHRNSSPFERLQVAGSLLERMIEGKTSTQSFSSLRDMHCEWIKLFASTLLESYLPERVMKATMDFFDMKESIDLATRKISAGYALHPTEESCAATMETNEAFDTFAKALSNHDQSVPSFGFVSSANDCVDSRLIEIIMTAYEEATSERDSALATLAVSSVLNDHQIMQQQLAKSKSNKSHYGGMNRQGSMQQSSDDEMLALCKQLGSEIAARTSAELEVNRLKEQLELERKIAHAKEVELQDRLSKKK